MKHRGKSGEEKKRKLEESLEMNDILERLSSVSEKVEMQLET